MPLYRGNPNVWRADKSIVQERRKKGETTFDVLRPDKAQSPSNGRSAADRSRLFAPQIRARWENDFPARFPYLHA